MKKVLKLLAFFAASFVMGILGGIALLMVLDGKSLSDIPEIFSKVNIFKVIGTFLLSIALIYVAFLLQVIVHEGGHLVAGLLTGFRFVSFRIFGLTLIRHEGKFQWRRFAISGTGGQCLMAPPQKPLAEINMKWYNMGGVLANFLVSTLALALFICRDWSDGMNIFLMSTAVAGYSLALLNGFPLKFSGVNNDGYNMRYLERSPRDKQLLCQLLEANAQIQEGKTISELPATMFNDDAPIDWSDGIQANWQMYVIARMEAEHRWEDAYQLISQALADERLLPLIAIELKLDMAFVCLLTGRKDEAHALYDDQLQSYAQRFSRTQSSKQRIIFTVTLLLHEQTSEALAILNNMKAHRNDYLMQGEVATDIELMEHIYANYAPNYVDA